MKNELATDNQHEISHFSDQQVDLIRRTVAHQLNQAEFELFISIASKRKLDPLLNQIHAVPRGSGHNRKLTMQVGIDGFRLIAARTGEYAGSDAPVYVMKENSPYPDSASVTVYRFVQGQRVAFTSVAFWDEFAPDMNGGQAFMWKKMPRTMLAKVAESSALRKAFPGDLSGFYENAEMDQADNQPPKTQASEQSKAIGVKLNPRIEPLLDNNTPGATNYVDRDYQPPSAIYGRAPGMEKLGNKAEDAELVPPPENEYQGSSQVAPNNEFISQSAGKPAGLSERKLNHNTEHPSHNYQFDRGKFAGKRFIEIDIQELEDYSHYMGNYVAKSTKPIPAEWTGTLKILTEYIAACV